MADEDSTRETLAKIAKASKLEDGEKAEVYDEKPGIFGRLFQTPTETIKRSGDKVEVRSGDGGFWSDLKETQIVDGGEVKVYKEHPGFWGRVFHDPDETVRVKEDRVDVYDGDPNTRFFAKPKKTIDYK